MKEVINNISNDLKDFLNSSKSPKITVASGWYYIYNFKGNFCQKYETPEEVVSYLEWSVRVMNNPEEFYRL